MPPPLTHDRLIYGSYFNYLGLGYRVVGEVRDRDIKLYILRHFDVHKRRYEYAVWTAEQFDALAKLKLIKFFRRNEKRDLCEDPSGDEQVEKG